MTRTDIERIHEAVETIRSTIYPSRHCIDTRPDDALDDIRCGVAYVIEKVKEIEYNYERVETYAKTGRLRRF